MPPLEEHRVVVTGIGILCPIGADLGAVTAALRLGRSGIRRMDGWAKVKDLSARVAGSIEGLGIDLEASIARKHRRSMGRVAQLAAWAAGRAIEDARLVPELLGSGRVGVSIGSTIGSPSATLDYYANVFGPGLRANKSTSFLQIMSHTCAANVALAHGVTGRVWAPASACTSASQAIGLGYDSLRAGVEDVMLCGGAEEVHFTTAAVFETVGAVSTRFNDTPHRTPRPFDQSRDGLVVGEGAGIVVLERLAHARARGARIWGEVIGFATSCDGEHITQPTAAGMESCMRQAIESADVSPAEIDYVNAHATATDVGDRTEAQATLKVFGDKVPISSTKGYVGHTLGACGAIETIFILDMMREGFAAPTLNLEQIDPACAGPWHLQEPLVKTIRVAMNNNFAFGGINTSLILRAWPE